MSPQAYWAGVSVASFFGGYNWQGEAPVLSSTPTTAEIAAIPSLICLSVRDFLGQGNWSGQTAPAEVSLATLTVDSSVSAAPRSLTSSVADFFSGFNRDGLVTLPTPAKTSTATPSFLPAPKSGLDLADLSGLF